MASKRTRSDAFQAASNHWNKKLKSGPKDIEIITIPDEDEVIEKKSPLRLLYNPSYPEDLLSTVNKDTVRVSDLIGSSDLQETFQFNFNVDLPFFLSFLDDSFITERKRITFITGSQLLHPDFEETEPIKSTYNIEEVVADVPNRFGTHHTKMMINFFNDDSVEIVIMSSNLTRLDFEGLTQMLWRSERLYKGSTTESRGNKFKSDLISYLNSYHKFKVTQLGKRLQDYNFSNITVELIASSPGKFDMTNDEEIYGYGKLYQTMKKHDLLLDNTEKQIKYNVMAQVSAMSYPINVEKWATGGIFSHLLCPLIFGKHEFKLLEPGGSSFKSHQINHNYTPHIVYPTVDEVANSNVGFLSGQAVHFNYTQSFIHKNYYTQNIKPYIKRWNSSGNELVTGREKVVPHVKLYLCDNGDDWQTLKWVYMGSHNLSKQAWGSRKGNKFLNDDPSVYEVSSYELGVLVIPLENEQLKPQYLTDTASGPSLPIRLPFRLPPRSYSKDDLPWSGKVDYGDKTDSKGVKYNID